MQEGSLLLLFCQHSCESNADEYGAPGNKAIKERRDSESGYYTWRNIDVDIRVELSNYSTPSTAASESSWALWWILRSMQEIYTWYDFWTGPNFQLGRSKFGQNFFAAKFTWLPYPPSFGKLVLSTRLWEKCRWMKGRRGPEARKESPDRQLLVVCTMYSSCTTSERLRKQIETILSVLQS